VSSIFFPDFFHDDRKSEQHMRDFSTIAVIKQTLLLFHDPHPIPGISRRAILVIPATVEKNPRRTVLRRPFERLAE
jgi:hypothetical protein